ncbi:MAG: RNA methyltransferase [Alphaproteobacteria bacterium]
MAGTDRSKARNAGEGGPAVILVEPQLGENIGFAARAMANGGLTELRLVRPRDGWPNDKAVAAASGADAILDAARLYGSVESAIADLQRVYATTARPREMRKAVVTVRHAVKDIRKAVSRQERCGILFGPERMGLTNDDAALADTLLTIPLSPGFSSLNLGHAVMVAAYEWFQSGDSTAARSLPDSKSPPATKDDLIALFEHLEGELDACGFLKNKAQRPSVVRNLRSLFQRAEMTEQEVRTLRGIIVCLTEGRRRPRRDADL